MFRRGDLVRVTHDCASSSGVYRVGDLGILLGLPTDPSSRAKGCWAVFIRERVEDFGPSMIERVGEGDSGKA